MQTIMKRAILTAIISAAAIVTAAAQTRTAYFMEGTTFRTQFNPALAPTQGYFNIPVLGGINVNVDGTLCLNDLLRPNPNGSGLVTILSSAISSADALSGLNKGLNSFNTDMNVNILGFGAYTKNRKNFWSFGLNIHTEAAIDIPYSFFDFAKNISGGTNRYDFSQMQAMVNAYADIGFSYSLPVTDKLYVGARAKFLVGLGYANMQIDRMNLQLDDTAWRGNAMASMNIYMNGLTTDDTLKNMELGFKGPAGYGFGIDVGATYDVMDNLQVSLAVNDIGFMSWGKSAVTRFETDENGIDFRGMDVVIDGNGSAGSDAGDLLSFDDFNLHKVNMGGKGATTSLRATINAGVEYELENRWVSFGLLYHARMGHYKSSHNLTAAVNFQPCYWFTLTPSYTFNNNSSGAVGLALNLCPSWINFFIATDMLLSKHTREWIPYKQDRMTFTLGLGVPMGKRGYRNEKYNSQFQQREQQKADNRAARKAAKSSGKSNSAAGIKVSAK